MPTGAILVLEIPAPLDELSLAALRSDFVSEMSLDIADDFYIEGPLVVMRSRDSGPIPKNGDGTHSWLNLNLWKSYYSPDYPRGDIELFVRCAQWLESRFPSATVWYGHDVDDENLAPFTRTRQRELLDHYQRRQQQ